MIKTKEIRARGYYIFESKAAANSNYIESINESKLLMRLAKLYLKDYLHIRDYIINRDGWQFVVSLKSKNSIMQAGNRKTQDENNDAETQIWRIISERVRLFISKYAQQINRLRGREGTFVRRSYEKFMFGSLSSAKKHLEAIRNQMVCMYQRKPRYRGLKSHYKIGKNEEKGSVFLCSRELRGGRRENDGAGTAIWVDSRDLVLPYLVDFTLKLHSASKTNNNSS